MKPIVQTAGVVLVRGGMAEEVLLLRAYARWDLPKGVVAEQESLLQAAVRETQEETGLSLSSLSWPWGQRHVTTELYTSRHDGQSVRKQASFFVANLLTPAAQIHLSTEHHEARWVAWEAASQYVVPRLQAVLEWAYGVTRAPTSAS